MFAVPSSYARMNAISAVFAKSLVKSKGKPKGGNKNNMTWLSVVKPVAMKKPKGKCFKCGLKGHRNKDCPKRSNKGRLVAWTKKI